MSGKKGFLFGVLAAALLCALITGCNRPAKTAGSAGQKKKLIGLSNYAMDVFNTEWVNYFTEFAEERGVTVASTNAEGKVDKQIADVESLIQMKPDVVVIRAVDSEGTVPAFEACEEAGIPTIESTYMTKFQNTLKLLTSQFTLCTLQGQYCNDWLESHPGEKLFVGYIWGMQGMATAKDRYEGWKQTVMNAYPDRVEILAEKVCNWSAVESMSAVEDWIQAFPQMNCIVAMSDEMALGAVNALQAAKKGIDQCLVIGIDGSPDAQAHLRDGTMSATVYVSKKAGARLTLEYAERIMNGEKFAGQTIDPGLSTAFLMTKDNIEEILAQDQ
jgi:ribose transport system substrate-binding protein